MAKFHDKYWYRDGQAKRCYVCISPQVKHVMIDYLDVGIGYGIGPESEYEEVCEKCGTRLAYWAYGSYDPCWLMATEEELRADRREN